MEGGGGAACGAVAGAVARILRGGGGVEAGEQAEGGGVDAAEGLADQGDELVALGEPVGVVARVLRDVAVGFSQPRLLARMGELEHQSGL